MQTAVVVVFSVLATIFSVCMLALGWLWFRRIQQRLNAARERQESLDAALKELSTILDTSKQSLIDLPKMIQGFERMALVHAQQVDKIHRTFFSPGAEAAGGKQSSPDADTSYMYLQDRLQRTGELLEQGMSPEDAFRKVEEELAMMEGVPR